MGGSGICTPPAWAATQPCLALPQHRAHAMGMLEGPGTEELTGSSCTLAHSVPDAHGHGGSLSGCQPRARDRDNPQRQQLSRLLNVILAKSE